MEEKVELEFLYWIMHRIHMTPIDEYLSLAYIWARDASECYRARDRTTTFSTFLFHFIRCKWSNYRSRKDFKSKGVVIAKPDYSANKLGSVEILADIARTANKDFYAAAVLISEGYSRREAAEALNMKPATLNTWISRYRKRKGEKV